MKVLGLTHPVGMDCAASLIVDGQLVGVYEEERFTRQKHAPNLLPKQSINALLHDANLSISDIDSVVVGFERPSTNIIKRMPIIFRNYLGDVLQAYDFHNDKLCVFENVATEDHYVAHAHSVTPYFNNLDANILILDGWGGEASGAAMFLTTNGELKELWRTPVEFSIGLFFQLVTKHLGFRPHFDEGKIMGLAAYGNIEQSILPDYFDHDTGLPDLIKYIEHFNKGLFRRLSEEHIRTVHKNIAATAQYYLERAVIRCAERVYYETKCRRFGLAGGVALNCVANGKLSNCDFVDELIVQPAANDSGISLGSAISYFRKKTGVSLTIPQKTAFLGPEYTTHNIDEAIRFSKINIERDYPIEKAVECLLSGGIIGIYEGRGEIGPRALGARSILADPRNKNMQNIVNDKVKRRESWRPFAPAVLEREASKIFGHASPFMTISDYIVTEWQDRLGAVCHVDGSARAQIVPHNSQTLLANILESFYCATGIPVLLNTSFNLSDEPMVMRPDHAIATFFRSGLDALCFPHGIIRKINYRKTF